VNRAAVGRFLVLLGLIALAPFPALAVKGTSRILVTPSAPETVPAAVSTGEIDRNFPMGTKAGDKDVAVIIGNRNYQVPGVPPVEYAHRDAEAMKGHLISTFGFRPENIIDVRDAGLVKFNEIFGSESEARGKLYNYVRKGTSNVFIYYVGHGAPDVNSREAYFVPVDADPRYIGSSGYRLKTFYGNLSKVPAKSMTVVLDACFSGNTGKGTLLKGISPALVVVEQDSSVPPNTTLFASGSVHQVSTWYPEKGHSLFTYFFLLGIRGEADANRDGAVTAGEMRAYLEDKVTYMARRLGGIDQTPLVVGNENEVLVKFKKR